MTGLPSPNTAWPPAPHDEVLSACQERQVWWEGDPEKLTSFYGGAAAGASPSGKISARSKAAWKAFWGHRELSQSQPKRLHVPIAADIGRIAANTLFSEPVSFTDPGESEKLGERIDLVLNTEDTYSRLLVAAESASMLSGVYGRTVWDKKVTDHAFVDFVDADRAIPTFKWGKLTEVSFWTEVAADDRTVLRHLQHYSPGKIDHALYEGTADNLGHPIALTDHPATAGLAPNLVDGTTILTGSDKLAAAYFPNHRPNPQWRNVPDLSALGRSDLTNDVIHLLDAMDRTWSSWMNDLELGRGRIVISDQLLTNSGRPGQGAVFNTETSIYSPVGVMMDKGGMSTVLDAHQFEIRVEEHARTFDALLRRAISRAGYSPLTFGLSDEAAATATEVDAKERDTNATRSARIRLWSALSDLATVTMEIDAHQFSTGVTPSEPLDVEWPATHQESELQRATTVEMWNRANSASAEVRVAYLHPDWDEAARDEEVQRILDQGAASMPTTILGPEESDFGPQPDDEPIVDDEPDDDPTANLN